MLIWRTARKGDKIVSLVTYVTEISTTLQWCHDERDDVSNHRRLYCLPNRLFRRRSKKTSNLRTTGLCEGKSPVTGEFPAQRASNGENVFIWWRHHDLDLPCVYLSLMARPWWVRELHLPPTGGPPSWDDVRYGPDQPTQSYRRAVLWRPKWQSLDTYFQDWSSCMSTRKRLRRLRAWNKYNWISLLIIIHSPKVHFVSDP